MESIGRGLEFHMAHHNTVILTVYTSSDARPADFGVDKRQVNLAGTKTPFPRKRHVAQAYGR